jgi:steroid 5-alpha reductase family enzyme
LKKNKKNKRKLYTIGLFKYSIHINYFGDVLWVSAYAIITRNYYAIAIPILLFCLFIFWNIPALDKYLANHYKGEFEEYKKKNKKINSVFY